MNTRYLVFQASQAGIDSNYGFVAIALTPAAAAFALRQHAAIKSLVEEARPTLGYVWGDVCIRGAFHAIAIPHEAAEDFECLSALDDGDDVSEIDEAAFDRLSKVENVSSIEGEGLSVRVDRAFFTGHPKHHDVAITGAANLAPFLGLPTGSPQVAAS